MQQIEWLCRQRDYSLLQREPVLSKWIPHHATSSIIKEPFRICLLCNWTTNLEIDWSKMNPDPSQWILVRDDPDIWIIINAPPANAFYIPKRTIVFQMEPNMTVEKWGEWAHPDENVFRKVFTHATDYNNVEWHLSTSHTQLMTNTIDKTKIMSVICSNKNIDQGQRLRLEFIELLSTSEINVDIYGNNAYSNMQITLPYGMKNDGMYPYKYHFAAENNYISNYFTEKIIDAILAECLCFYWGCPNISEYIDPNVFILVDLNRKEEGIEIIQKAIANNEWEKRIDSIRMMKRKILNEMTLFHRIV